VAHAKGECLDKPRRSEEMPADYPFGWQFLRAKRRLEIADSARAAARPAAHRRDDAGWSLDKLGPMARGVEDTLLALAAITGPDAGF
jgi:hypothetical protein